MDRIPTDFFLSGKVTFFSATLRKGKPYLARLPRNHESLFFVTSGNLIYESEGKRQVIRKGEVGYIPKGSVDSSGAYLCDEVSYIATNFNFSQSDDDFSPSLPFDTLCACTDTGKYEKLFEKAHFSFISTQKGSLLVCKGILLQIIGLLFGEQKDKKSARAARIFPAIEMMEKRFSDSDLRVSELALACGMSVKNFRRLFFEEKGENPYEYLRRYRIGKAEILLMNTAESVSDIATMCGFSDLYSFSHSFRRQMGIPPAGYRKTRI